jgi:hypothetical protein
MQKSRLISWCAVAVLSLLAACDGLSVGVAQLAVNVPASLAPAITRVSVTSSGPGIPSITVDLVQTQNVWSGVIGNIPIGTGRTFRGEAFDASGNRLFVGETSGITIAANQTVAVALTLQQANAPTDGPYDAPIIEYVVSSAAAVRVGGTVTFEARVRDPNPGDPVTCSWTGGGTFSSASNCATTTWTAPSTTGSSTVTLTATDSRGASASVMLTLQIVQTTDEGSASVSVIFNNWPVIRGIGAQPNPVRTGQATSAAVTASDPDGDTLQYRWSSSCAGSFNSTTASSVQFTPSAVPAGPCNNCRLTVTVTDGRGGSTTGSLGLCISNTLAVRYPPTIIRSYQSSPIVSPGQQLTFEAAATDPQNSALSFQWSANVGTLGTAQGTATTSRIVWTAPACIPNNVTSPPSVTVRVTNAYNLSDQQTFTVAGLNPCVVYPFITGPMATVRNSPAVALLPSGHALVTGGSNGTISLINAELYNPLTRTWSPTAGPMNDGRHGHTATTLRSGQVLIVGGWPRPSSEGSSAYNTSEIYDPATGNFTRTTGNLAVRHAWHTATLLNSDQVLVVGGRTADGEPNFTRVAELYNPTTGTWTSAGSLPIAARYGHTTALLSDGRVLVAGGYNGTGDGVYYRDAALYDPRNNTWTQTGSMARRRTLGTATLLPSGQVLVAGGDVDAAPYQAELYNPTTGTWTGAGTTLERHISGEAVLLSPSRVLLVGGTIALSGAPSATVEIYNLTTGTWTSGTSIPEPRTSFGSVLLNTGEMLITGGRSATGGLSSTVLLYVP